METDPVLYFLGPGNLFSFAAESFDRIVNFLARMEIGIAEFEEFLFHKCRLHRIYVLLHCFRDESFDYFS